MPVPSSSARAPGRRAVTRGPANAQALLAAAHRLVLERGEDFTTQDLIKEADVALQTFYRHFGGKDQLLIAVFADMIAGHCDALEARAAHLEDSAQRIRFYIAETISTVGTPGASGARFMTAQHWRLLQRHPEAMTKATKPFADLVQHELEHARDEGTLASRDPARDAWMINKLTIAVYHHYAFADAEADASTIAEDVWDFCLAGIGGRRPDA